MSMRMTARREGAAQPARRLASLLALLATGAALGAPPPPMPAAAPGCALQPLAIGPAAPDRTDVFVGRAGPFEVRFLNERREGPVETFPDSPLIVAEPQAGRVCEAEGGIWVRSAVFLSVGAGVLMAQEFSGSNDALNFYDARRCRKLHEIDVSGWNWTLDGERLVLSPAEGVPAAARPRRYRLDAACRPVAEPSRKP